MKKSGVEEPQIVLEKVSCCASLGSTSLGSPRSPEQRKKGFTCGIKANEFDGFTHQGISQSSRANQRSSPNLLLRQPTFLTVF